MQEFYDLNFDDLKDNIKNFMASTDSFKDYNFEGSGASQIIDVLAFITQYSAFYLSQSLNELFMKTVQMKDNVYKLSSQLNYLPKRKSAPYLTAEFQRNSAVTIVIPKFTKFIMGGLYLTNIEDITIDSDDVQNITLYEGEPIEEIFLSEGTDNQEYALENRESIDNEYFYVYVDVPNGLGGYTLGTTPWLNVNKESFDILVNGFYIRYFENFSIAFDSGSLFNKPNEDDRIRVTYIKTNGTTNNGKTGTIEIDPTENILNSDQLTITNSDTLVNGTDEESEAEIKLRAPLFYATQNRAVTEADHNVIAKTYSKYDIFYDTLLWGGEKESVDVNFGIIEEIAISSDKYDLGHVYVSALKSDLSWVSDTEISNFTEFLDKQKFLSIFFRFLHPSIISISPTINISFESKLNLDETDIQNQINTYLDSKDGYKKSFYLSNIIGFINGLENVQYTTVSYTTKVKVKTSNPRVIRLYGEVTEGSLSATIDSLPLTDSSGDIIHNSLTIGSINYSTGFIRIDSTFTDTEYEITFEYVDKEKIILDRESFLKIDDIVLNSL